MKKIATKTTIIIGVITFFNACSSNKEENISEISSENKNDKHSITNDSITANEAVNNSNANFKEKQIGTDENTLLEKFSQSGESLRNSEMEMLGIDQNQSFITTPETGTVLSFEYCNVFVTHMYSGASDLYTHHTYYLTHFDIFGERTTTKEFTLKENVSYDKISLNFIGFTSVFEEYVSGEYVMEATGDTISEHRFFYCTENELINIENMSSEKLRLCRNEIYAYHGYKFKDEQLKKHFLQYNWYNPLYDNVDKHLSENDKNLIAFIKNIEEGSSN